MKVKQLKLSDVKETSTFLRENIRHLKQHYTAKERNDEIKKYSAKNLQALIKKKEYVFRAVKVNGKVAGVIVCTFPDRWDLKSCWINWIIVKEGYQRMGIGSMLVRNLEKITDGKWNKIQCRTRVSNIPSSSMFTKLGYRKVATLRRRVRKMNAYTWEKILKNYT